MTSPRQPPRSQPPSQAGPARIGRWLLLGCALISGTGLFLLMVLTVADVVGRALAEFSVPALAAFTGVSMVILVFLALGPAEANALHVRVPLVTSRLAPPLARRVRLVGLALSIAITAIVCWAVSIRAYDAFQLGEQTIGDSRNIPIWPARIAIAFGFFLFLCTLVAEGVAMLRRRAETAEVFPDQSQHIEPFGGI